MTIETTLDAPAFLIAVPQLGDPNFMRSVVMILEHGDQGSMGLVISRATNLTVGAFCGSQGFTFAGDGEQAVYIGGPVQTERAFILHSPGPKGPETEEIIEGVSISYSLESLRLLSESPAEQMRVFLGYAGWAPGQLAAEIREGAWLVHQPSAALVFAQADVDPWNEALKEMGIEPAQLMHSSEMH